MGKLLRQQTAADANIDIFTGDRVVEKKIDDPWGRLTRLPKYTDG